MRLDKLRGFGPWFAFASPLCFVLSVLETIIMVANIPPGTAEAPPWFDYALGLLLALIGLFFIFALMVAIDLEWIEHPRTNTSMTYIGLGGMIVAVLAYMGILIEGFAEAPVWADAVTTFLMLGGAGVYLVIMNFVGRRAKLLGNMLSSIGIVCGGLTLVGAGLTAVGLPEALGFPIFPALALYLVWSVWLGFKLRGKAPEAVAR